MAREITDKQETEMRKLLLNGEPLPSGFAFDATKDQIRRLTTQEERDAADEVKAAEDRAKALDVEINPTPDGGNVPQP
jgi:uncharacterized protein YaiL (DUF2058 family)